MNNYLDGFGVKEVSLLSGDISKKGVPVKLVESFVVSTAENGDDFVGVCTYTDGNTASVLLKGYAKLPYSGTAPDCGYVKLTADGNGAVKSDENGRAFLVTDVDTDNMTCGIIF